MEAQVHERWGRALRSLGVPRERSQLLAQWLIEESIRAQEALWHGGARSSPDRPARGARAARAKSTFAARPRRTRVLKFGGSIVGDPVRVARAVDRIVAYAAQANVVVVASAPGNLTDDILELLPPASWARSTSESLRTLTRGEELGARILDAHVRARGVTCRLRLPEDPDWPIVLQGEPGRSEVDLRRSGRRARALFSARAPSVTVLPGFVGIDRHGAPSLLPRGGSDVTAVALGR